MEEILARLEEIEKEALSAIEIAHNQEALEEIRVRYLGRKGIVNAILRGIKDVPPELRPTIGQKGNEVKEKIQTALEQRLKALKQAELSTGPRLDITLPGRRAYFYGTLHPITQTLREICDIFLRMGFEIAEGPDVEVGFYNFDALNIPPHHPARDMHDTFFVAKEAKLSPHFPKEKDDILLRTHTSSIQIRVMKNQPPPVRIIAPGAVYRCDADVSHTPMFHQVEGLLVDKNVSFTHLKGILTAFMEAIFGEKIGVRFRPSYFPFTEPSAEMDISCVICGGKGCRVCKGTGWLEILGCGMVDPAVFIQVGYDPEEWTGFAFGLGVERIAMLKYGIDDIRLFFENHLRFLRQF